MTMLSQVLTEPKVRVGLTKALTKRIDGAEVLGTDVDDRCRVGPRRRYADPEWRDDRTTITLVGSGMRLLLFGSQIKTAFNLNTACPDLRCHAGLSGCRTEHH